MVNVIVSQNVEKQEKSSSLTVKAMKLYCVSNCFSPDWRLWEKELVSGLSS